MVTVETAGGATGTASYMQSASFGEFYGDSLLDEKKEFEGNGVLSACAIINSVIGPALIGKDAFQQSQIDEIIMDSLRTTHLTCAVNITSPVSFAVLKAAAAAKGEPLYRYLGGASAFTLPVPGFLCASGSNRYGVYDDAQGKPNYAFVAYGFDNHDDADYAIWEVEDAWENMIAKEYGVRPHRGFSMAIPSGRITADQQMWELMNRCIREKGYEGKVGLHADLSAHAFWNAEKNMYAGLFDTQERTRDQMIETVLEMAHKYNFVIIQDPLNTWDLEGYAKLTAESGVQIVGSDVFGTDLDRLHQCLVGKCFNTMLLRVQKYPTFSDCVRAVNMASSYGVGVMPMDSAGEDEDIVDYAIGFHCGTIYMSGPSCHGNWMPLLEDMIGPRVRFFGRYGLKGKAFELRHQTDG